MGRSFTPKYRLNVQAKGVIITSMSWNTKSYGRPTLANLTKLVELYRLGNRFNEPLDVTYAAIERNTWNGETVAVWRTPVAYADVEPVTMAVFHRRGAETAVAV